MLSRRRRVIAGAAAVIGAASLLLLPFVGRAGAAATVIDAYDASGSARAIQLELASRPGIFDPLVQIAVPYARTQIASLGQGSAGALATQVFPGDLVNGAITCMAEPAPTLGIAQAAYPPDECNPKEETQRPAHAPALPPEGPLVDPGRSYALAKLYEATATATVAKLQIPGLFEIATLETSSTSRRTDKEVVQESVALATGLKIADTILIDSIRSIARITSDGVEAQPAPLFEIGRVRAIVGGQTYDASIDQNGIHLVIPGAEDVPSLEQNISQALQYQLGKAGIARVLVAATETFEDGPAAEATIGGLQISLGGAISGLPIPTAVREVLGQIQNDVIPDDLQRPRCPLDDPETEDVTPPCVNPIALIPLEGTQVEATFSIAGASAKAFGFPAVPFDAPPEDGVFPAPPPGGDFPGDTFIPNGNGVSPVPSVAPQPQAPPAKLYGLVARLPSSAVISVGLVFLVFAVGVGFAPSSFKT